MSESTEQNDGSDKEGKGSGNKNELPFNFYWIYALIIVILLGISLIDWQGGGTRISPSEFEKWARNGDVKRIVIQNEQNAQVHLKKEALQEAPHDEKVDAPLFGTKANSGPHYRFNIGPSEAFQNKLSAIQKEAQMEVEWERRSNWGGQLLQWLIPIGLMVGLWLFLMRRLSNQSGGGGQLFNIGKSKAKVFDKDESPEVQFDDVAGSAEAKEEIQEIVDFLKHPKKYTELGAEIPKGALLIGQPGTGKTLLAKAVAGEANVPFFSISGSDFVEMFVGVGASRVRDLFKQAKEKAPAIIFIDEIDAIGSARNRAPQMGGNDERENTLNQLLSEMDGFDTNSGIILMGATNRPEVLDNALLRPGRFDRRITVDMPDLNERKEIFEVHLAKLQTDESVDAESLGRQTPGFSGADIANICNEAALTAARNKKTKIDEGDFSNAVDRVIAGLEKKNKIITPKEKKVIAYHEAGHAVVSWLVKHASPLVKVSVVPRGQTLGAAWYLPEERQITTEPQILDELCAALGGRASEDVIFGQASTGALNDLEKVTKQAYAMVSVYGLSEKIGNRSYYDNGQESRFTKPYSDETAREIDEEANRIIEETYARAKGIIEENKENLGRLAQKLLEEEVIFREDLERAFGKKNGSDETSEEEEALKNENKEGGEGAANRPEVNTDQDRSSTEGSQHGSGLGEGS